MTFKEILDLTKNRIDELDESEQIDIMLKGAVNHAYIYELAKYDKRVSSAFVPVINGLATLPDDIDAVESISPSLVKGEKRLGNVITSSRSVTFTVLYSTVKEPLVNDTDELDMSNKFKFILSSYACFVYFQYRKKADIANMYYNEYRMGLEKLVNDDNFGDESVLDIYEDGGDE
jgi:hypothetical protein